MRTAELPTPIDWEQVLNAAWDAYEVAKKKGEPYKIGDFIIYANTATSKAVEHYWNTWIENCWWLLAEGHCLIVDHKFTLVTPYTAQEIADAYDPEDDPILTPDGREICVPCTPSEGPPISIEDEAMADSLIAHLPAEYTEDKKRVVKQSGWYISKHVHGPMWLGEWWKHMMMDLPTVCPKPIAPTPAELGDFFRKRSMAPAAKDGQAALF